MTAFTINSDEARIVKWALGAMEDFWRPGGEAERDGMTLGSLPRIDGALLFLSDSEDVNSDLLYRVTVQWREMTAQGPERATKQIMADFSGSSLLESKLVGAGVPDWLEVKERYAA